VNPDIGPRSHATSSPRSQPAARTAHCVPTPWHPVKPATNNTAAPATRHRPADGCQWCHNITSSQNGTSAMVAAVLANVSAQPPTAGVFTGRHVLAELVGVEPGPLDDEPFLRALLVAAVTECGATVCQVISQRFQPQGVTVLALLSESHASLHSYPENGSVFVDVFTCGDRADPRLAVGALARALRPSAVHTTVVHRGGDLGGDLGGHPGGHPGGAG